MDVGTPGLLFPLKGLRISPEEPQAPPMPNEPAPHPTPGVSCGWQKLPVAPKCWHPALGQCQLWEPAGKADSVLRDDGLEKGEN